MTDDAAVPGRPAGAPPLPVVVGEDPEATARAAALDLAELLRGAVAARGVAHVAVSGGRTPWRMLTILDSDPTVPWAEAHVYQVDERVAPDGDPERNLTALRAALPRATIHAIPVTSTTTAEEVARAYAATLPERFDVVHLGLGADGHTASLVPDDPVLEVADRSVAATSAPYAGRVRVTLTYPGLARARAIRWLVTGADKRDALHRLLTGDPSVPAGRVARAGAAVFADRAAIG